MHHGHTAALQRASALPQQVPVRVTDSELRALGTDKVDWQALAPEERLYLQQLNLPPPQYRQRARRRRP
ncbi:MAG: hypothetical protein U1F06_07735 [Steroidobacteraceae bacterium]